MRKKPLYDFEKIKAECERLMRGCKRTIQDAENENADGCEWRVKAMFAQTGDMLKLVPSRERYDGPRELA